MITTAQGQDKEKIRHKYRDRDKSQKKQKSDRERKGLYAKQSAICHPGILMLNSKSMAIPSNLRRCPSNGKDDVIREVKRLVADVLGEPKVGNLAFQRVVHKHVACSKISVRREMRTRTTETETETETEKIVNQSGQTKQEIVHNMLQEWRQPSYMSTCAQSLHQRDTPFPLRCLCSSERAEANKKEGMSRKMEKKEGK